MSLHPVQELLGGKGFCIEVVRCAEHRHEQLGTTGDRRRSSVIDRDRLSGEVDEEPLACAVLLAK
jgi:hypothetical protein